MLLKYIYFCLYINLRYLVIYDYTHLIQHLNDLYAYYLNDLFSKYLYADYRIFILFADNVSSTSFTSILINISADYKTKVSSTKFFHLLCVRNFSFNNNVNLFCNVDNNFMFNVEIFLWLNRLDKSFAKFLLFERWKILKL